MKLYILPDSFGKVVVDMRQHTLVGIAIGKDVIGQMYITLVPDQNLEEKRPIDPNLFTMLLGKKSWDLHFRGIVALVPFDAQSALLQEFRQQHNIELH